MALFPSEPEPGFNELDGLHWCREHAALILFDRDGTVLVQWAGGAIIAPTLRQAVRGLRRQGD